MRNKFKRPRNDKYNSFYNLYSSKRCSHNPKANERIDEWMRERRIDIKKTVERKKSHKNPALKSENERLK